MSLSKTDFAVNDALSNKLWSKYLTEDTLHDTWMREFMGSDEEAMSSLVSLKTDFSKDAGDKITCGLLALLTGEGKTEGETLYGNEEALTYYNDSLLINELWHGVDVPTNVNIAQQRVPYPIRQNGRTMLKTWAKERLEYWFFNALAGNTAQSNTKYTGMNAATAPTTNRVVRAGAAANDQSLGTTNLFDLSLIDVCVEKARTLSPRIRPIVYKGKERYVMFVHEYQATDLRRTTSTADWFDIVRAKLEGGQKYSENELAGMSLGEYNGTLLLRTKYLPNGVHSTSGAAVANTKRAVFCGAQALMAGFGKGFAGANWKWAEESKDYGRVLGIGAGLIGGMKKTVFNSEDFGVITVPTYAAAHTS